MIAFLVISLVDMYIILCYNILGVQMKLQSTKIHGKNGLKVSGLSGFEPKVVVVKAATNVYDVRVRTAIWITGLPRYFLSLAYGRQVPVY